MDALSLRRVWATSRLAGISDQSSRALPALSVLGAVALALPASAGASDAALRATLTTWSHRIALDATGIGLSASRRHPRRMTHRAQHFRADALQARRATAAVRPSSARGRRAKRLALAAFLGYANVGRRWTLAGEARIHGKKKAAAYQAGIAQRLAKKANGLLVTAGGLLR